VAEKQDIRWEQRFSNYLKAFDKLDQAVTEMEKIGRERTDATVDDDALLDDIIKDGVIQRFEYTHELAWKVMKDFLEDVGNVKIYGSKDATKEAFAAGLILDGDKWMDMILGRNKTSHTYNEETADEIFTKVIKEYYPEFKAFAAKMAALRSGK